MTTMLKDRKFLTLATVAVIAAFFAVWLALSNVAAQDPSDEAGTTGGGDAAQDIGPITTTEGGAASGPDVAVLAYCTDLGATSFGAQNTVNTLVADGRFNTVTLIDGDVVLPTAAFLLANFDGVIAMTDNRCGLITVPGAAAMAGFANGGGGVVLSTFGFSTGIGWGAAIFAPGLSPFQQVQVSNAGAGPINVAGASNTPPCNLLMAGVTSPVSSTFANFVSLSAGATLCTDYNNGRHLLAVNQAGNVCGLNTFPASQNNNGQASYRRLVSNAVFVCSASDPVLDALEKLEAKADRLEGKADSHGRASASAKAVANLERKADNHGRASASAKAVANLERKADLLEKKVDAHARATATAIATAIAVAQANAKAIATANTGIGNLEKKADALEIKADKHARQTGDIDQAFRALVAQLFAAIDNLEKKLDALANSVSSLPSHPDNNQGNPQGPKK